MASIKQTVESTLGFHGRIPDPVTASIIDALEVREAQIQADLLAEAVQTGLDEDDVIDTLHRAFSHTEQDTPEPTFDVVLDQIMSTSRLLSQQTALLADLH